MRVADLRAAFSAAPLRVTVDAALIHMYAAAPRRSARVAHTYVLTDDDATAVAAPARRGRAAVRSYSAAKPSQAAMKAFYSFMRTPTGKALAGGAARTAGAPSRWVAPLDAPPATLAAYAARRAAESPSPSLVAKVCLRRADENRVRRYAVRYVDVERPNRHEVARGITRVAWATPLTAAMHTDVDVARHR